MKANELMIGDWVKCGKRYMKVTQLAEDMDCDDIDPIPLTIEILEKNGFHKEWDEDIKLMVCDTIIVETGNNYKLYKDGKMYLRRVLAPLYYIHQLQHALKLCGIEKEIVL